MPKYFNLLETETNLSTSSGAALQVAPELQLLSARIISECSFLQLQVQEILFRSYGAELVSANRSLKKFASPKARMRYLCDFPYLTEDVTVNLVFNYARTLFQDIYELRNALAHEAWLTSAAHPRALLLSSLDNQARLLLASGKVLHFDKATPEETYHATINYIRHVKILTPVNLTDTTEHIALCSWALMHITAILDEPEEDRKEEARRAFRVFRGTAHLFGDANPDPSPVNYSRSRSKSIEG